MATYAIGDIQGCFTTFGHLLEAVGFNATRDRLWLVGDLINRGPGSLAMLRWAHQHAAALEFVLGNHDLHALAVAEGLTHSRRSDTLDPLLTAPDAQLLFAWLRQRPLAWAEGEYLMIHAGVLPSWDTQQTLSLASEVEAVLRNTQYRDFLSHMYGNQPDRWQDTLSGMPRLRVITNALTRLRICTPEGTMEFAFKGQVEEIPEGYLPWFDVPGRKSRTSTLVCGHWSALGLRVRHDLMALDSGCLWGGPLSAIRLEDRRVFQVPCAPPDVIRKSWHDAPATTSAADPDPQPV